jgi:hypothetical protein
LSQWMESVEDGISILLHGTNTKIFVHGFTIATRRWSRNHADHE